MFTETVVRFVLTLQCSSHVIYLAYRTKGSTLTQIYMAMSRFSEFKNANRVDKTIRNCMATWPADSGKDWRHLSK